MTLPQTEQSLDTTPPALLPTISHMAPFMPTMPLFCDLEVAVVMIPIFPLAHYVVYAITTRNLEDMSDYGYIGIAWKPPSINDYLLPSELNSIVALLSCSNR